MDFQKGRFSPNEEEVTAKIMDGEAIIINLTSGTYYSMDNVGALVWELIENGMNFEECVSAILERYEVTEGQARSDMERLASDLFKEHLIIMSEAGGKAAGHKKQVQSQKVPYEPPELHIYRDMKDLLALDPPTPGLEKAPWQAPSNRSSVESN